MLFVSLNNKSIPTNITTSKNDSRVNRKVRVIDIPKTSKTVFRSIIKIPFKPRINKIMQYFKS